MPSNGQSGTPLYAAFQGTEITGPQRNFSWEETQAIIDTTSGSDPADTNVAGRRSFTASFDGLYLTGAGSAIQKLLQAGEFGTLVMGPQGTVAGLPKMSREVRVTNFSTAHPYDDATTITCEFVGNGDWIENFYSDGDVW